MTIAPPFIKRIVLPNTITTNTATSITVHAEWPNPSWSHVDTQIFTNEDQRELKINYMGQRGKGMAIMRIEPFTFAIDVVFPIVGEWTISVATRGGEFTEKCVVKSVEQ